MLRNWQKFLIVLSGIVITTTVFAAPASNILRNILPETNLIYEIGTSTARWFNIYTRLASTSAVSITNSLYIGGTASTTGTATTTIVGANATSTFSGGIRLVGGCFEMGNGTCAGVGGGSGITTLNTLTGTTQTFTATNADLTTGRYATLTISSSGTDHNFILEASSSPTYGFINATSSTATSTFSGGLLAGNSLRASFIDATSTFRLGTDQITDITGTGLSVSAGALTNSGVISNSCSSGITCSGTNPSAISLDLTSANTWTNTGTTTFNNGLRVSGAGTSTYIQNALQAGILNVSSQTATSTISGGLYIGGGVTLQTYNCANSGSGGKLTTDSAGNLVCAADGGGGAGTPGGSDTQFQYNDATAFAGAPNLVYTKANDRVGIGTTTPSTLFSVAGQSYYSGTFGLGYGTATSSHVLLDSNLIGFGSSTASTLTISLNKAATTTIPNSTVFAYSIATSTGREASTSPIFSINTDGNRATSTFVGGLVTDSGNFTYDWSSGQTSIDSLNLGTLNFDTDAGLVSWINLPVTATDRYSPQGYSAQINTTPILTVYAEPTSAGGISTTSVGIGTTTPQWTLQVASTAPIVTISDTDAPLNQKHWSIFSRAGSLLIATSSDIYATSTASFLSVLQTGAVTMRGTLFLPGLAQSGASQTYNLCGSATFEAIWDTVTCLVSALKFKKDIQPISYIDAFNVLLKLKPVTYLKKEPLNKTDAGRQPGFIADQVETIDSKLVTYDINGDIHGFRYEQFTAYITAFIQGFYKEFQFLVARVVGIENKIKNLELKNIQLEERIKTLENKIK